MVFVSLKSFRSLHTAIQFQHPVYGTGFVSCHLTHTLRRPARRSCKKNFQPLRFKILNNGIDGSSLARTRPSCYDEQSISHGFLYGIHLLFIQFHLILLFQTVHSLFNFRICNLIVHVQPRQHSGCICFHKIKCGSVNCRLAICLLHHQLPLNGKIHIMFGNILRIHFQQFTCPLRQLLLGQISMPFHRRLQ